MVSSWDNPSPSGPTKNLAQPGRDPVVRRVLGFPVIKRNKPTSFASGIIYWPDKKKRVVRGVQIKDLGPVTASGEIIWPEFRFRVGPRLLVINMLTL